jgi:hypothetical protein
MVCSMFNKAQETIAQGVCILDLWSMVHAVLISYATIICKYLTLCNRDLKKLVVSHLVIKLRAFGKKNVRTVLVHLI